MARGDAKDLFLRKLRLSGVDKSGAKAIADRLDAVESAASGAAPGTVVWSAFAFDHATPGLETGITLWTPSDGDLFVDAFIGVIEAFDGTTPKADVGFLTAWGGEGFFSLDQYGSGPIDMTAAEWNNAGYANSGGNYNGSNGSSLKGICVSELGWDAGNPYVYRNAPGPVRDATTLGPLGFVLSQTGTTAGASTASTVGRGVVYVATCTPVVLTP